MSYEQHESLDAHGSDPHDLLFGPDPDHEMVDDVDRRSGRRQDEHPQRGGRRQRHDRRRQRRRRRLVGVLVLLLVAIVGLTGWFVVRPVLSDQFGVKDYAGPGTSAVQITINPGDNASAIAETLKRAGVVRSAKAFTDAAKSNSASRSLQPGVYAVRKQMAASQALDLLLSGGPIKIKVLIPEGTTAKQIVSKLATALDVPLPAMQQAATDIGSLGLPAAYGEGASTPKSAEGFLFPDTYSFDPGTSATDALQQMVADFASKDRAIGFAADAGNIKLSPYQALTIASMIEGEAKFPEDRPKVARVILNRMAKGMALGIDATSVYGAELAGQDPSTIDYDKPAPYNTRNSPDLPPTPIGNPGEAALRAAVAPAAGTWLYYVNGDSAGHLYFATTEAEFTAAVARCKTNHWGCT